MSDAAIKHKIDAHKRMSAYYAGAEIEEGKVLAHSELILKLVQQTPAAERETYARQNLSLYQRIAVAYANRGMIDKALETLRAGDAETRRQKRTLPDGSTEYASAIKGYLLVGQPAPVLTGAYWINSPPETKELALKGNVTLIQFTAHWCAPCRDSYPAILKLYRQYKPRGFDVVMSTQLYGYFADRPDLKPEEEVGADRDYYINKQKLPFTIAVDPFVDNMDKSAEALAKQRESNYGRYFVGTYPQTIVVDKEGIVRLILRGWGPDNESRTIKMIEELLK